jgi:rod shape-determining protein MreC
MRKLSRRQQLAAIALSVLALLFISLDFAGGSLSGARGGTTGALGSLYRGTDSVIGPVRRFIQGVPDVAGNRRELARLRLQNQQLQQQLYDAAANQATARRLSTLQLQADSQNWKIMPARVIATGPGAGFAWTVTVDAGSRDGVQEGQTVTDGLGLVGRVLAVHQTSSVVLLAADPASGVGVRDVRSGQLLLATGKGTGGIVASPLDGQLDVRRGDRLVTGPAGKSTFAPGITVGTVSSVGGAQDGTVTVQLVPATDLTRLDLVGIVLLPTHGGARPALVPGQSR